MLFKQVSPSSPCLLTPDPHLAQSFVDELEPGGSIPHYAVKLTAYGGPANETFEVTFPRVNLAYFGSSLSDGRYNLTFTLLDGLGNSYPPAVTRRIGINTTMFYPSFRVGPAPTSCPTLRNVTLPCGTTADCNGFPCTASGCMCREDWFGLHCDHDLHEVPEYLPADDPGLSPWTCAQVRARSLHGRRSPIPSTLNLPLTEGAVPALINT